MEIYLATPRGFCAGVDLAVDIVKIAIEKYGKPVYVKHQIVHNPKVVDDVEKMGAITVDQVNEVPDNSVVVFSAHGSPPEDYDNAKKKNLTVLDATCPLVTRVHNEAKKYKKEGKKIILVGHKGHQEVIGTTGQSDMKLIDDRDEWVLPKYKTNEQIAVLTQTTLSVDDTSKTIKKILESNPSAIIRNDICYATTNRQQAAIELADLTELVLVIGASNSSNCNRLRDVALKKGVPAYLINGPEELDLNWIKNVKKIGITSGASTPEKQVQSVIKAINPKKIHDVGPGERKTIFSLPKKVKEVFTEGNK
tara:strand:+ start:305 stop:1228 length:924 start_codon:yes stop_codon:yes gene_type:complete